MSDASSTVSTLFLLSNFLRKYQNTKSPAAKIDIATITKTGSFIFNFYDRVGQGPLGPFPP